MYEHLSFWQPSFEEDRNKPSCTCKYIYGKRYIDPQRRCAVHKGK